MTRWDVEGAVPYRFRFDTTYALFGRDLTPFCEKRQNILLISALSYCFFILNMLKFRCITIFDDVKGVC